MHRILAMAGAALLSIGLLAPRPASAMTLAAPAGLAAAAADTNQVERAAVVCGPYRCARVWPRYRPYYRAWPVYRPYWRPIYRPYWRPIYRPWRPYVYRPYWGRRYWW